MHMAAMTKKSGGTGSKARRPAKSSPAAERTNSPPAKAARGATTTAGAKAGTATAGKGAKGTNRAESARPATTPATKATKGKPATPAAPKVTRAKPAREGTPKRLSAISAAADILRRSKTPMRAQELITAMDQQGLWRSPGGKTPHATLYAAIIREIATKGTAARFRKVDRGQFESNA